MACPLFQPSASLGDYYSGECTEEPGVAIPKDTLRHCCNIGYARNVCPQAARTEADAIEFVLRFDNGGEIQLGWAMERNHHPLAVGTLIVPESPSTPLEFQARAFGMAYLRQKI